MLVNKKKDMTPFDMNRKPSKQYFFLLPLIWGGSFLLTRKFKLKLNKVNMKEVKTPFLVVATHQGFCDYYLAPLALFPRRAMYVSDMEGFAGFGKWLYRGLGCIGKRRYVSDISVITNMKYALTKGQSVVIYPESRHSNVGTTAYIANNLGKLSKMLGVPVVTLSAKGCYLANPFWDETHTRKVPIEATLECIFSIDELKEKTENEIQSRIEEKLQYDEYDYQHKKGFLIKYKNRAQGLHKALYQCKECKTKYMMKSSKSYLYCNNCYSKWELTTDGWLEKDGVKTHIPDWYNWQRKNVNSELFENKAFAMEFDVEIEALPNEYGFVKLGNGKLFLNRQNFRLVFNDENGELTELVFAHSIRESVQTEYDYRGRGMCIVLSTKDCCYYLYSKDENFQPTELQFIGEELFQNS